jgi:transposase
MTDLTTPQPGVREQQLIATRALARALETDLPPANWTVSPHGPLKLDGLVPLVGKTDTELRAALAAWADFLGTEVASELCSDEDGDWTRIEATADYEGASLRVWTNVEKKAAVR